jgi:hypothetical protein
VSLGVTEKIFRQIFEPLSTFDAIFWLRHSPVTRPVSAQGNTTQKDADMFMHRVELELMIPVFNWLKPTYG